jgi:8-amino-7-oxononanoate synthase
MDPQHRLLVELGREAIQDAGWERDESFRAYTGVFAGMSSSDVRDLVAARCGAGMLADGSLHLEPDPSLLDAIMSAATEALDRPQSYSLPGCLLNMGPAAVSHVLNLHGPAMAIDSACSSSLVALDLAVRSIQAGSCRAALVGGVFLNLTPTALIGFSRVGALSRIGECRPFDARADGFVLGEGGALVLIRPLVDAQAAGDRVYAVIRGIGTTNDGGGAGILTPSVDGQVEAIEAAYDEAGVPPEIDFLEAHGTGTVVGDHVEAESLRRVREKHQVKKACYLSSSKAIFGHSLAAAGAIGLVKTTLAVHHRTAPPLPAGYTEAELGLSGAGVIPLTEPQPLVPATDRPVRAAINSFGFGGTNVHVLVEEAPPAGESVADAWHLVVLSAGDQRLLAEHARAVADQVEATTTPVEAVARTLATRGPLAARLAIVTRDRTDLVTRLRAAAERMAAGGTGDLGDSGLFSVRKARAPRPRLGFLFPGQGAQRPGMLQDLVSRFTVARDAALPLGSMLDEALDLDLTGLLYAVPSEADEALATLTRTEICQPALGLAAAVTTGLLEQCGVRPDVVLGHSVGEFSAAMAAGVVDPAESLRFLAARGAAVAATGKSGNGAMLALRADLATFERLCEGIEGVWLGCHNGPEQIVASGRSKAIGRLAERCAAAEVIARRLTVSHAFHSPLVAKADRVVAKRLAALSLLPPTRTLISSVSGAPCDNVDDLRELWSRQNSSPVRFHDAVAALVDGGVDLLVQVSGTANVLSTAARSRDGQPIPVVKLSSGEPDGGRTFLRGLGALLIAGVDVDPRQLFAGSQVQHATLPPSPLATERCSVRRQNVSRARPLSRRSDPVPTTQPVPVVSGSASTVTPPAEGNTQVSEIVELCREQIALLSSLERGGARVGEPDPSTRSHRIERHIPPASALEGQGSHAGVLDAPTVTKLVDQELSGILPGATAMGEPPANPVKSANPAKAENVVLEKILDGICAVTAFPRDAISPGSSLRDELGLDSLMFGELLVRLRQQWPGLSVAPEDFLEVATVEDAANMVAGKLGLATAPEEDCRWQDDTETFEEIVALNRRYEMFSALGVSRDPYFITHERTIRDTTMVAGRELVSFASYNYLGLSGHPVVLDAAKDALDRFGSSVSAARMLSGQRPSHVELDRQIADLLGAEEAVTLVGGHATNVGIIGHLFGTEDLVVHDALAHDSILQGCRLSRAARQPFPHNDLRALDTLLTKARREYRRVLVVVEGVYSMDGDIAPLPELIELKRRHHTLLMVDEAHSIGVLGKAGRGISEHFGVAAGDVDIWMGTLSKSFASCGGYLAGRRHLIDYLRYTLPGFIYSAGMTPANTAAASAAIKTMLAEPERVTRLRERGALFLERAKAAGIDVSVSGGTPIVPCVIGDSLRSLTTSLELFDQGISVNPILHPAVEERATRLRFFVTSEHTAEQIINTVATLKTVLASSGRPAVTVP